MNKRYDKSWDSDLAPAVKKTKIDNGPANNIPPSQSFLFDNDDVWGDDFNEEEMVKEVDLIISQRSCQELETTGVNKTNSANNFRMPSANTSKPSTSTSKPPISTFKPQQPSGINNHRSNFQNHVKSSNHTLAKVKSNPTISHFSTNVAQSTTNVQSQVLAGSSMAKGKLNCSINYEEFKQQTSCTSTQSFNLNNCNQSSSDDPTRAKLREDNRQLMTDLREKQGEAEYLRKKLKKMEEQLEKERKDKEEQLKLQESKYKADIHAVNKQKEEVVTQLQLKTLDYEKLTNRFKHLQTKDIKLVQPSTSYLDTSMKGKFNSSFCSKSEAGSSVPNNKTKKDSTISVNNNNVKPCIFVNDSFIKLPGTIYETSLAEKPVVNIHIVQKCGRRNLPILQGETSFKIFENAELVKPIVTMIGNQELTVKFFLPDLSELMTKNEAEINSVRTIAIINKLVATTRELLLNSATVLQKISEMMTNDDIRDMNDAYFSEIYNTPVYHTKTIFDGNAWNDEERGIEARRSLGVLSHIALKSTYLSEYIGGKMLLLTRNDTSYSEYINYMITYNSSSLKNTNHEFLQLLLKFVSTMRLVRRAHQFTGLLNAIVTTLINAQKRVPFQDSGIKYAFEILKEIILSRPLLQVFIPVTQMIEVFGNSVLFIQEFCKSSQESSSMIVQSIVYYKLDACILEMYLKELQYFTLDPITIIRIVNSLLSFIYVALYKKSAIVIQKSNHAIIKLLQLITNLLCDCLNIDTETLKLSSRGCPVDHDCSSNLYNLMPNDYEMLDDDFWDELKFIQFHTLKKAINFFNYLAARDSKCLQFLDIALRIATLLEKVTTIKGLILRDIEVEAINNLKKILKEQYNLVTCQEKNESQKSMQSQIIQYRKR